MNTFEKLIGKKILGIKTNPNKDVLVFSIIGSPHKNGQPLVFRAVGDCCSRSWIEDMDGLKELIGKTVTSAKDIEMPAVKEDRDNCEVILAYGFKIVADGHEALIEMRNESNGYYGGQFEEGFSDKYGDYDDEDFILQDLK